MKFKSIFISLILVLVIIASGLSLWWFSSPKSDFRQVSFELLPGWNHTELKQSFHVFQSSCRVFINQDPEKSVGTDTITMQAKDWQPACRAALKINPQSQRAVKQYFQTWFTPIEFYEKKPVQGLFTGYFLPLIKGSYTQSKEFNVPVYEVPENLVTIDLGLFLPQLKPRKLVGRVENNKVVPFYTREQINKGAIKKTARVLLWINSAIDRLFLEIEGSGVIELDGGERVNIGYGGQNGAPYTSIANVLIKDGIMTRDTASMQAITRYLKAHPKEMDKVINQNKSFVFFRKLSVNGALGSQGVVLTPGYSMAIDRKWIPMGAPLWLSTTRPDSKNPELSKPLKRLMVAQDTGGAIRGKVRGDVFWGGGERATLIAGHMKNEGRYWLLLPRPVVLRLFNKEASGNSGALF